jgi:hypothetical protein
MLDPDYSPEEERAFARGLRNCLPISLGMWAAIIAVILVMCGAASAQNATAGAASQSGAQAAAGSNAGSASIIQQTFQGAPAATRNVVGYEGSYRQDYRATIRNTPDAYAPPVTGGTNPCSRGLSAGGSVAGFGLGLGGSWSDPDCERRNLSALLHNQGQQALAQEVLCETDAVRNARRRLGQPCAADIPPGTPVVSPAPVAAAPREVIGGGAAPVAFTRPAWCETASPAERRQYRSTCG